MFGIFGAGGSRPIIPGFVFVISVFKTDVGMDYGKFGAVGWLLAN